MRIANIDDKKKKKIVPGLVTVVEFPFYRGKEIVCGNIGTHNS